MVVPFVGGWLLGCLLFLVSALIYSNLQRRRVQARGCRHLPWMHLPLCDHPEPSWRCLGCSDHGGACSDPTCHTFVEPFRFEGFDDARF